MFLQNHRWVKTELFLILQCTFISVALLSQRCSQALLRFSHTLVLPQDTCFGRHYHGWRVPDYPWQIAGCGPQVSLKNICICHSKMDGNILWCDSSFSRLLGSLVRHKKKKKSFPSTPLCGSQLITIKCTHDMPCWVWMSTFEVPAVCRNINCYIISWGLGWMLTLITVLI